MILTDFEGKNESDNCFSEFTFLGESVIFKAICDINHCAAHGELLGLGSRFRLGKAMTPISPPKNSGFKFSLLWAISRVTRTHHPRGLTALLRYLLARLLRRFYDMDKRQNDHFAITIDYDDDLLINVDTASFIEWWVFFFNEYEGSNITNLIKRIVRPGAIVLDVGDNIGVYTLVMSRCVGDAGRVYAFEPQPQEFSKLRENVSLNRLVNVRLMACALSDQSGAATLYSHGADVANRAASSLRLDRVSSNPISQTVELSTIDEIVRAEKVDRLDFLKIDTEGHDFRVLRGAQASISRFRPHVVFEYHEPFWQQEGFDFSDAEQFFNELDYSLYVLREGHLTPVRYGKLQMNDILAAPRMPSH